jgi:hypothetical protein
MMHWRCYWPAALTQGERDAADWALKQAEYRDDQSADDFLDGIIILCPGCRS